MSREGIGASPLRKEDRRFLTGRGRFTDDITLPGQAFAQMLRSPYAHARITGINATAAAQAPGVLGIYTAAELGSAGLGPIRCQYVSEQKDGSPMCAPTRPLLANGVVRHVGEGVALVVAESLAHAQDAAHLVEVEYEERPCVSATRDARLPESPLVWPRAPANTCFVWGRGDEASTDTALRGASHVTSIELVNNRLVSNAIEPRNALGHWSEGRYTLYSGTQGVHLIRRQLADEIFGVPREQVRVVTPDVGGGFGTKGFLYPEQALVLFAARDLGRPVKWTASREEAFVSDSQGRDHVSRVELGLDNDGRFVALRVRSTANLGAYLSNWAIVIATLEFSGIMGGVYAIPAVYVEVTGAFTHTVPVDAYRGAGRPEAMYAVERTVDAAARELDLDPVALRRRNFIASEALPYHNAVGTTYDSGDFSRTLGEALSIADYEGFADRRAAALRTGHLRGFGVAYYIETNGAGDTERAYLSIDDSGAVTLLIGTQSTGQSHETVYAQIVADRLGIDLERIAVTQGDSDLIEIGTGTSGSRSMPIGGVCCDRAAAAVIDKGKRIAARELEAAVADITFEQGVFGVAGTDHLLALTRVAELARDPTMLEDDAPPGLTGIGEFGTSISTNSNGCHICELQIDRGTGVATIVRYTVVDDLGTVINPTVLAGQVHGGTVQGIGQALLEACIYDPRSGQLLSGSLLDYCVPRADDLPFIDLLVLDDMPCKTNPMGIKGAGEVGSIGAPPAVINAVVDALATIGAGSIDMPATPEKIWRAIHGAKSQADTASPDNS